MKNVHGIVWPSVGLPTPAGALVIAEELERTQWWSADQIELHQRLQLHSVLTHAASTVPHYRRIDPLDFASVPVMTRAEIIAAKQDLLSNAYPSSHGPAQEVLTSRTSGEPVRVRGTSVVAALHAAITLRDHRWHGRDLHAAHAVIRHAPAAPPPDGITMRGWSAATARLAPEAPMSVLTIAGSSTTDVQLAWLVRADPTYLLTYPTVLDALLRRMTETGTRLPKLRQVRTVGERLSPDTRRRCEELLGVPLVDAYSAQEVGYIALQCPEHEHYHVQAERVVVEVLRDDGSPCAPGETGRIVVTDLHNFATPILRYDIGDLAEVGGPCPCGRALPVLDRIVGRVRDMLVYPDGKTTYPVFTVACREAARYQDLQLVQLTPGRLRARVVPNGELDGQALISAIRGVFGHPFDVEIELVEEIARTTAGKLEEFISLEARRA